MEKLGELTNSQHPDSISREKNYRDPFFKISLEQKKYEKEFIYNFYGHVQYEKSSAKGEKDNRRIFLYVPRTYVQRIKVFIFLLKLRSCVLYSSTCIQFYGKESHIVYSLYTLYICQGN